MPSRIGKQPIKINDKVKVEISKSEVKVTGPLGEIILPIFDHISVQEIDGQIICKITGSDIPSKRAMQGLLRNLISNAIVGVSEGWQKKLDLVGVGYRVAMKGNHLELSLGFSHPVIVNPPTNITFVVNKNNITVSGFNKQLVGNTAAHIRSLKKPEPYKGKGIKYSDEHIRRKAGKTAKAVGSGS